MKRILLPVSILFFVSCSGGNDPTPAPPTPPAVEIAVDKPTLEVSSAQSTATIAVTSNSDWEVSGMNSWCRVDKSQGSGNGVITVTIDPNDTYDSRKVSLTFIGLTKASSTNVIITQAQSGGLFIGTADTTVSRHQAEIEVKLLANVEYDIIIKEPEWIISTQQHNSKALVPATKRFTILKNETTSSRSSQIIFRDKNSTLADTITVAQKPSGEPHTVVPAQWDGVRRADIFYQIFVRSFADSDGDGIGDLQGITAKLDYIKSLGCTGIWLTPINPSPSYHGYDVTDYEAVNPQFGTMADFDALVAAADARGIKVILDFVINHSGNQHPWFKKAVADPLSAEGGYYLMEPSATVQQLCESGAIPMIEDRKYNAGMWRALGVGEKYYAMFDGSMPDLNYGVLPNLNPVYGEILDAAKFWMARGAAGLRLDAVKHIYQDENSSQNWQFLNRFYTDLKSAYPDVYMVGEVLSGMDLTAKYFAGLPSLFHFDSWWKIDWAINNSTGRYYAKDMNTAIDKFKSNRADFNACIKLSNHDEDRAISKLSGSIDKAKIAFAAIMTTPGQPYIYYGEELGMSGMKGSGDENVREPLPWGDNYTTTWTPMKNNAALPTVAAQKADAKSLLSFYVEYTKLRNTFPALSSGTLAYPDPESTPKELMIFTREKGSQKIMVIINVSTNAVDYEFAESITSLVATHGDARLLKMTEGGHVAEMAPLSVMIIEI